MPSLAGRYTAFMAWQPLTSKTVTATCLTTDNLRCLTSVLQKGRKKGGKIGKKGEVLKKGET